MRSTTLRCTRTAHICSYHVPLGYKQWGLLVPATTPCGHPRQHQLWLAASTGNGAPGGGVSIDDDADSGLGRLRFNKREQELPQELQGADCGQLRSCQP